MSPTFRKLVLLTSLIGIIGCGKGFQDSTTAAGLGNNTGQGGSTGVDPALTQLAFKGVQAQGDKVGRIVLELDRANEAMILVLPLPTEILKVLGTVPSMTFPNLPGAKLFMRKDGTVAVSIPLKYIVRNGTYMPSGQENRLPNGDPLPAFPSGEGAQFGLDITTKYKVHLYVGVSAAAVFIETPDLDKALTCGNLPICPSLGPWEVRNEAGQDILGYVAFVYAVSTYSSGAFVTAQLPPDLARFIDDHIKP